MLLISAKAIDYRCYITILIDFTPFKQEEMNKVKYTPQPIDTTDVELPGELEQLVEQMSKNVHDVWAETRIKQGWKYGERRNDELKTHPCLVPYEELPEEEKEYDRNTSIGTLKLIMKLGFEITKTNT